MKAPDVLFDVRQLMDHLRIFSASQGEQDNLTAYQAGAVEWIEGVCGCSIMPQQWRLSLEEFPYGESPSHYAVKPILFPRGPLISIDEIKYTNGDGVEITDDASKYVLDKDAKPPALYPPYGGTFPTAREYPGAVKLLYTTGMGIDEDGTTTNADNVRDTVKMAVKFLVSHWFRNREPVPIDVTAQKLPYSLEAMLWAARIYRFDWDQYYSC